MRPTPANPSFRLVLSPDANSLFLPIPGVGSNGSIGTFSISYGLE
ncbi:hypothetical protein CKA32_002300 [Geitlerinema sp. FC II]|nr:hypothetical protein CKA32_002300 [Geitlerinema sp. FC II]